MSFTLTEFTPHLLCVDVDQTPLSDKLKLGISESVICLDDAAPEAKQGSTRGEATAADVTTAVTGELSFVLT